MLKLSKNSNLGPTYYINFFTQRFRLRRSPPPPSTPTLVNFCCPISNQGVSSPDNLDSAHDIPSMFFKYSLNISIKKTLSPRPNRTLSIFDIAMKEGWR